MPPHLQREDDALVSLDGDAGHCEDARHDGGGLNKGDRLADHDSCRTQTRGWRNESWKLRNGRIPITGPVASQTSGLLGGSGIGKKMCLLTWVNISEGVNKTKVIKKKKKARFKRVVLNYKPG